MGYWFKFENRWRINTYLIKNYMKSFIKDIAYYLPERVLTNEDLLKEFPEWSVDKVASKVGISQRHLCAENETASDMAVRAAEKLFAAGMVKKNEIDFILLCTQSPDYFLPSTSCVIQKRLGLSTHIGAFDYNLGCSGYVYGLSIAKGFICAGIAKNVLLLTSETYNKHIHPKDKGNRAIFGDGATASIISTTGFAEIGNFSLGTDGGGASNLMVKTGGMKYPDKANDLIFDEKNNPISSDYLYMNGPDIFNFTIKAVPPLVKDTLLKNNLKKEEINLFIFHQANKFILTYLRKKLKISEENFYINMTNTGNTISSTLPIAICDIKDKEILHGNILLTGFGVGYSWGGVILKIL